MTNAKGTDIAVSRNAPTVFNDDLLSRITSMDDALAFIDSEGLATESVSDYGTGFSVLPTQAKESLIGVPFVILDWRFTESQEYMQDGSPTEFVSAEIVTKHGEKFILNDGSTGIFSQLKRVTESRKSRQHPTPQFGLRCEKGLSMSEYPYTDDKGNTSKARTFYLAE